MGSKRIVVVGAGIAGKGVIQNIRNKVDSSAITLIEPREYFEVPFAQLRGLVDPDGFGRTIRKPIRDLLPEINHIADRSVALSEAAVILADGTEIPYDILVLGTGSRFRRWDFLKGHEVTVAEREAKYREEGKKLADAARVLIVGGGPLGVELAGEIASKWQDKEVTLVQGPDRLLDKLSAKMSSRADRILRSMDVNIHVNTKMLPSDRGWRDNNGNVYPADVVFLAVGIDRNTAWLADSPVVQLDGRGAVKVNPDLRVPGSEGIFALGDINDVPEAKMGAFANIQAKRTAGNIIRLLKNSAAKLSDYKPAKPMSIVTIGPEHGAAQLPFGHFHPLHRVKQRDLFCGTYLK